MPTQRDAMPGGNRTLLNRSVRYSNSAAAAGSIDEATLAQRLQRARTEAGLSQAQVADLLGIPRPAVSLIESGQRSVSSVELAQLARAYGRTPGSFLETASHDHVFQWLRATAPAHGAPGHEADSALAEAVASCRRYASLELAAFGEQRYEVPAYPIPRGRAVDQGEYLAERERRRIGIGDAPVASVVSLLEHEGVKVVLRAFPPESQISGCYLFSAEIGPCVVINKSDPASRRRFTAAHEYAHFLVERDAFAGDICVTSRRHEFAEMRANAFAAAFLLPAGGVDALLKDLGAEHGGVRAEHAVHLMYHFGVSYRAVLWRLLNCGWLTDEEHQRLESVSPGALARVLGYAHQEPGSTETEPDRQRAVAIDAWRNGALPLAQLAVLLGVPVRQLRPVLTGAAANPARPLRTTKAEPDWF